VSELDPRIGTTLGADPRVEFVLVFGSVARGDAGPHSDLDLAVGLREGASGDPTEIALELLTRAASLAPRVDLVLTAVATPFLAHRIARDGRIAFARDPRAVVRFRAEAFSRFPDWARFVAVQRDALVDRLEEGTFGR